MLFTSFGVNRNFIYRVHEHIFFFLGSLNLIYLFRLAAIWSDCSSSIVSLHPVSVSDFLESDLLGLVETDLRGARDGLVARTDTHVVLFTFSAHRTELFPRVDGCCLLGYDIISSTLRCLLIDGAPLRRYIRCKCEDIL